MLLMEAKEKLEKLINFTQTRLEDSADLVEAYQMAVKCIDAQIRLADLLNDFANDLHNDNLYSVGLVYEFLSCIRHDAVFDEDGIFLLEETEGQYESDKRSNEPF